MAFLLAFHLVTFLAIRIIFLPHLVALMAFLPLERLGAKPAPRRVLARGAFDPTRP